MNEFNHISFDADGYPTDDFLEYIRTYNPHENGGFEELLGAIQQGFRWSDRQIHIKRAYDGKQTVLISTGGWSGNESIIYALKGNVYFWTYWRQTNAGGHYKFRIPVAKKFKSV